MDSLMGLQATNKCLCKRLTKERHRKKMRRLRETEIGMRKPYAKGCLEPPEAGRGRQGFFPRGSRGPQPCRHLGFRLSSKTGAKCISISEATQFVVICDGNPRKLRQGLPEYALLSKGEEEWTRSVLSGPSVTTPPHDKTLCPWACDPTPPSLRFLLCHRVMPSTRFNKIIHVKLIA